MAREPSLVYSTLLALSLFTSSSYAAPKVVSFDLTRSEFPADVSFEHPLSKRAGTVGATLYNAQSNLLYLVNATIGTPGQQFSLQLDTGSSDIWVCGRLQPAKDFPSSQLKIAGDKSSDASECSGSCNEFYSCHCWRTPLASIGTYRLRSHVFADNYEEPMLIGNRYHGVAPQLAGHENAA
jgi:hypothetical protein